MNIEQKNNIYKLIIKNLPNLNELLKNYNCLLNQNKLNHYLKNYQPGLDLNDLDYFLSLLLLNIFNLNYQKIRTTNKNPAHIIIIESLNVILEELHLKQLELEVYE